MKILHVTLIVSMTLLAFQSVKLQADVRSDFYQEMKETALASKLSPDTRDLVMLLFQGDESGFTKRASAAKAAILANIKIADEQLEGCFAFKRQDKIPGVEKDLSTPLAVIKSKMANQEKLEVLEYLEKCIRINRIPQDPPAEDEFDKTVPQKLGTPPGPKEAAKTSIKTKKTYQTNGQVRHSMEETVGPKDTQEIYPAGKKPQTSGQARQ